MDHNCWCKCFFRFHC